MRIALALAVVALAVGPIAGAAQAQPLTDVTYVTGTASSGDWVRFVAERQGFFASEGLHVSVVYAGTPPSITQAIATQAAQFGHNGVDSWIVAVANGLPVKLVGSVLGVTAYSLMVSPEIKTWDDLKGKTVMLGTKKDITAIVLEQLAKPHHLGLDDFSIAIGGNSTARYAALESGNAQGAILAQPFDMLAEMKGMRVLATSAEAMPDWTSSGIAVNPSWAATHRSLVVKFMRALRRAVQYGYGHKAELVADLIAELKVDPAIAARSYDVNWTRLHVYDARQRFTETSFRYMTGLQVAMGILKTAPAYADVFDGSFVADGR